jgi:hypothetical protein
MAYDSALSNTDVPLFPDEERRGSRHQIPWSGMLQTSRGPLQCRVLELSAQGAKLSVAAILTVGQAVTLVISGKGTLRGAVVGEVNGVLEVSFAAAPIARLVPA